RRGGEGVAGDGGLRGVRVVALGDAGAVGQAQGERGGGRRRYGRGRAGGELDADAAGILRVHRGRQGERAARGHRIGGDPARRREGGVPQGDGRRGGAVRPAHGAERLQLQRGAEDVAGRRRVGRVLDGQGRHLGVRTVRAAQGELGLEAGDGD